MMHGRKNIKLHNAEEAKPVYQYKSPLSTSVLCRRLQRATIPDAVIIQFGPPEDGHVNARNMSRIEV